jgi:anti-sigma-K factor RskA
MRYDDPDLQDQLAAQYALGALTGPARRRLETLMRTRPALQERVSAWEDRLAPLADTAPPIVPSGHRPGGTASRPGAGWPVAPWRQQPFCWPM